jgi:hypothetical protein
LKALAPKVQAQEEAHLAIMQRRMDEREVGVGRGVRTIPDGFATLGPRSGQGRIIGGAHGARASGPRPTAAQFGLLGWTCISR